MKGTLWDTIKGGLNFTMALLNNLSATTNPGVGNDGTQGYEVGSVWVNTATGGTFICTSAATGAAVWAPSNAIAGLLVVGVAAGYKIARGAHQQAAAADTFVTGLATVVACNISFKSVPTIKQLFCSGAPDGITVGNIVTKTFKPTAVNDVTPIAATDFTDNINLNWIAIGT